MGIMNPYFPTEMAVNLANLAGAETFIETGTYMGGTSKWASGLFKTVHTIELSEALYNQVHAELLSRGNIMPHFGDSRTVLPKILENINGNIIFWLDGHYSAGVTAGKDDPCPLLKELEIILKRNNDDIIIIDDARCLGKDTGWPTLFELYKKIEIYSREKRYAVICDDNLYIVPDNDKYKEPLLQYILERNISLWKQDSCIRNPKIKIKTRMKVVKILRTLGLYKLVRTIYVKWINKMC